MSQLPQHIAIIMDGNGRWAAQRKLPRMAGHNAGAESAKKLIETCVKKEIKALSLFAFSLENRGRPLAEVDFLMSLFSSMLNAQLEKLHKNNIRFQVIGDRRYFSKNLLNLVEVAEERTVNNTGLVLSLAVNYTGRWDITEATRQLAREVEASTLKAADIQIEDLNRHLSLSNLGDPDLLIRTSGEQRVSNFMLWQLAYTELYFTNDYWPDFDETAFEEALQWYATRQRRFGLIETA